MFLAFPGGGAGVGLLLLRLSVAGSFTAMLLGSGDVPAWMLFLAILVSIGLCAGFLARLLACLSVLADVTTLVIESVEPALAILNVADAIALAMIGPGAFSMDARLFGRRTVVLPAIRDTMVVPRSPVRHRNGAARGCISLPSTRLRVANLEKDQ